MPRTPDHGVVCSVRLSPWLPLGMQMVHTDASIRFPTHRVPLNGLEMHSPAHWSRLSIHTLRLGKHTENVASARLVTCKASGLW